MKTSNHSEDQIFISNNSAVMSYCEGGVTKPAITKFISSKDLYKIIQSDDLKNRTNQYREAKTLEEKQRIKKTLPCLIPGGTFDQSRAEKNLIKRSGYVGLDFDKVEAVKATLNKLGRDQYVHMAKLSISEKGLHVLVKVDIGIADHKTYVKILGKYFDIKYDLEVDAAVSNVSSSLILSHTSNIWYNRDSQVVGADMLSEYMIKDKEPHFGEVVTPKVDTRETLKINLSPSNREFYGEQKLKWAMSQILKCEEGTKHVTLRNCSCAIGTYVVNGLIDFGFATKSLKEAIQLRKDTVKNMKHAFKTIENGIKYGMENPFNLLNEVVTEDNKWWRVSSNSKRNVLCLQYLDIYNFFEKSGFFLIKKAGGEAFVHIEDNIIEEVTDFDLIQHLRSEIDSLPYWIGDGLTKDELHTEFLIMVSSIFNPKRLKSWKVEKPKFIRDTRDSSYFFFKNGFVEVTGSQKSLKPYSKLNGNIWKSQIRDRAIVLEEEQNQSEYRSFIQRVVDNDDERFKSLRSYIAYLMHGYKDPAEPRAGIFVDELISENPEGGTGKGLVIQGIEKLREITMLDGKTFSFDRFAYQRVTPETQVLVFEDVQRNFNFEKLFAVLSNGMTVEVKNENEFEIPFEEAPKILLTSNYTVGGEGNSNKRRQYLIEFSQHYNEKNTPLNEFGHRFFDEWDECEWNRFDNFMMDCMKEYLQNGVQIAKTINVEKKKLMQRTNKEFMLFAFKEISLHVKYDRDELIKRFNRDYGGQIVDSPGGVRKFNEWVDDFVSIMGWYLEKTRGSENSHKYTFFDSLPSSKEVSEYVNKKKQHELERQMDSDEIPLKPSPRSKESMRLRRLKNRQEQIAKKYRA